MKKSIAFLAILVATATATFLSPVVAADPQAPIDPQLHAPPIVVACVGDSITANGNPHGYPAQLGNMLGDGWKVENFGVSGTTLMTQVGNSYQKTPMLQQALASSADVVVIMLGTNDSKEANWPKKDFFIGDYKDLIEKFKAMASKPRIFIMKSPYVCATNRLKMSDAAVVEQGGMIDQIAKDEEVGVLDAHAPTAGHDEYFGDGVHPRPDGAGLIAKVVYEALTGKKYDGAIPNFGTGK
jgi:lysophospholipase L1-like esterase